ncbi:hypothetical protein HQQ80_11850 [Microbacteriaceae bacterium VKM Ac-2855]|nr:hypothetical protein [Microbacteriaceae bacterium VKM Ac-2855]
MRRSVTPSRMEITAAIVVLRSIAIGASSCYTLVVGLEAVYFSQWWTVAAVVSTLVLLLAGRRWWSSSWLAAVSAAGVLVWLVSAASSPSPASTFAIESVRPLGIGIALVVVGLGATRLRTALTTSAVVVVLSLGGAMWLGAPTQRLAAAALWSANVTAVCAIGGWGMRRGATLAVHAIVTLASARRDRVYGEQFAHHRRELDVAVHDSVLATLSMLSHNGIGIDARELRERCRNDLDGLTTVVRAGPGSDVLVSTLIAGWRRLAESLRLRLELEETGVDLPLPNRAAEAADGAVREALRNVRIHAGTDDVRIRLGERAGSLTVEIIDHGVGFELRDVPPERFGIARSIIERMNTVGGHVLVRSAARKGTRILINAPRVVAHAPRRSEVPAAEQLRRASRAAPLVIGWVGAVDAAVMVLVFWNAYVHPALAAMCIVALAVVGIAASGLVRISAPIVLGIAAVVFAGVTVIATVITPGSLRFSSANVGITGVSLALAWLYRLQSSRWVLLLAVVHTTALLVVAVVVGAADPADLVGSVAMLGRLAAETILVPVGLALYLRSAGRAVIALNGLDIEAERVLAERDAGTAATEMIARRRAAVVAMVAPVLEPVADGRLALPLGDDDAARAAAVARRVRDSLAAEPATDWLASAIGQWREDAAPGAEEIRLLDGDAAADAIPSQSRAALLAVLAVLRSAGPTTVVVTDYGDSVDVVATSGPGLAHGSVDRTPGYAEAIAAIDATSTEIDGYATVEVGWADHRQNHETGSM